MRWDSICIVVTAAVLVMGSTGATAEEATAAAEYRALIKQWNEASVGIRAAKTDGDRMKVVTRLREFPSRFAALAEKYPKDPVALNALRQAVQTVGTTDSAAINAWEHNPKNSIASVKEDDVIKIVTLLTRDHLNSKQLGLVCDRMRYGYRMKFLNFLDEVTQKSPHREVRGIASIARAQFLIDRANMARLLKDRPALRKSYASIFGKSYPKRISQLASNFWSLQIIAMLETAQEQYGDVKTRQDHTVGEIAKAALYEQQHLAVGMVAPDIKGKDEHGKPFKLSDYRGKVVLLYFWNEY